MRPGQGWQFPTKNYSAEDEIDGIIGLFWRNSGCSVEQKTLGIPFRTIPQKRRILGILYNGTKMEANSRNSVLNHSAEQKTLGIPFRTVRRGRKMLDRSKLSEICSEACLRQKHAVSSVCWSRSFCKTNFFRAIFFRSEPRNRLFRKPRNAQE